MHLRLPRPLTYALFAVPLLAFAGLLYSYAVNIPWFDDIETFVEFMPAYDRANTPGEKLWWLFKPNNEHRVFFGKLVVVAVTRLTGELNFRYVIGVGGLCLLGTLAVLFRVFRWRRGLPVVLFAPVLFWVLQPQFHLASLWAITSMQHIGASFFVMSGLYLLSDARSNGRFAGAVLLQTMAGLSMSNGLFGWVAGAGVLLVQRRYAKLGLWLGIAACAFWFYFHDFASPQGNESSISFFLKHPHLILFGFFTFIGGLFDFFPARPILWRAVLPTLAGMALVAATARLLWHDWKAGKFTTSRTSRQSYFLLGAYGFLWVNALAVGFLRPRFGYEVMLISNYMLYPALWVSLLYLHWVSEQPAAQHGRSLGIGLAVGTLVWVVSYNLHWPLVHERRQRLLAFAFNQRHTGAGLGGMRGTPLGDYIDRVMRAAESQGYYHYPAVHPVLPDSLLRQPAACFGPLVNAAVTVAAQPDRYQIEVLLNPPFTTRRPAYLLLQSATDTYLLTNQSPLRLITYVLNRPVVALKAEALKAGFLPGQYRVGWASVDAEGHPAIRYTQQEVAIR